MENLPTYQRPAQRSFTQAWKHASGDRRHNVHFKLDHSKPRYFTSLPD